MWENSVANAADYRASVNLDLPLCRRDNHKTLQSAAHWRCEIRSDYQGILAFANGGAIDGANPCLVLLTLALLVNRILPNWESAKVCGGQSHYRLSCFERYWHEMRECGHINDQLSHAGTRNVTRAAELETLNRVGWSDC